MVNIDFAEVYREAREVSLSHYNYLEGLQDELEQLGYPVQAKLTWLDKDHYNRIVTLEDDAGTWTLDYDDDRERYIIKFSGSGREFTEYKEYGNQVIELIKSTEKEILDSEF